MIRLFFVGSERIAESIITLNFDRFITPKISQTYLYFGVTPPPDNLLDIYQNFGIDVSNITVIHDYEIMCKYSKDIDFYEFGGWITQQLIKLMAVDQCQSDQILIQDCDNFRIQSTNFFVNNIPTPLIKPKGTHWQSGQAQEYLFKFTGTRKETDNCYVTEFMPLTKDNWRSIKHDIESRYNLSWLDAMITQFKNDSAFFPQIRFSEYELIGHYLHNKNLSLPGNKHNCYYLGHQDLDEFTTSRTLSKNLLDFAAVGGKMFNISMSQVQPFIDYVNSIINK